MLMGNKKLGMSENKNSSQQKHYISTSQLAGLTASQGWWQQTKQRGEASQRKPPRTQPSPGQQLPELSKDFPQLADQIG